MKEKIRPIYSELQGYLKSISQLSEDSVIRSSQDWNNYNNSIEELNKLTNDDYERFKLVPNVNGPNSLKPGQFVKVNNFKIQASGLISRIYGKYFADEKNPLDGSPSTIINTTQTQNQSIKVEIAVEMTELISQKILEHKEGSTERTFLEQIRDGLKTGKNIVELINLILSTGSQLGLTTAAILQLLSK